MKSVLTFDLGRRFRRRQGLRFVLHSLLEQRLLLRIVVGAAVAVGDAVGDLRRRVRDGIGRRRRLRRRQKLLAIAVHVFLVADAVLHLHHGSQKS